MNEKRELWQEYINILLAGLLTILLLACSDDRDSLSGQASGDPLLTFNMTRAGGDIVGNTLVYLLMDREVMLESSTIRFRR